MMRLFKHTFSAVLVALLYSGTAAATSVIATPPDRWVVFGVKVSLGVRYDALRAKEATSGGIKERPFLDVSLFLDIDMRDKPTFRIDLPVFRPIYFAAAHNIFHFEPEVVLLFRVPTEHDVDVLVGPTLGATFYYGADDVSLKNDTVRAVPFFAIGPRIGGYVGLDAVHRSKPLNFQVGISPYYSHLFSVNDPQKHRGFAIGSSLEGFLGLRPRQHGTVE